MAVHTDPDIHQLVICANIFVTSEDKVLMIRRSLEKKFLPGYVQPIGGKVELNEDPLTAAKRELMEEAGLEVKNVKLKAVVTEEKRKKDNLYKTNWQIFHFAGEFDGGTVGTTEEGELIWLTKEELRKEKVADSIKALLDFVFDKSAEKVVFAKYIYGEENKLISKRIQEA